MPSSLPDPLRSRTWTLFGATVLALAGAGAVWAQGGASPHSVANAPPGHGITCSSSRGLRDYQSGLKSLYQEKLDEALRSLQNCARRDPTCAMAHWGLSRVHFKARRLPEAIAESKKAVELRASADDREVRLINAWDKFLEGGGDPKGPAAEAARNLLTEVIALYPEDPEVWLQRAASSETPLRGAPFVLAALRLQPNHPLARSWSFPAPPLPTTNPAPSQPVASISATPKLFEGLGMLSHPTSTRNQQAQAYYEQGLRCLHAYVLPANRPNSAGQCFQYAANLDPDFAMAYWGLSFCPTPAMPQQAAASRAVELASRTGSDKERRFCAARLLELSNRREEFLDALDGAIVAYPDDAELWTWRGKVYGAYGFSTGTARGIPYQLAALMIQPQHPSPNHELVHAYEELDRPALGWRFTEGFRASAPNMPHANHMQAHLAMRIGRWDEALDCTRKSRQRSLEGYPELDPYHHADIMFRALGHEGKFKEAEAEPLAYRDGLPWVRVLQLKAVPEELEAWASRRSGSPDGLYVGAIAAMNAGDAARARPMIDQVEQRQRGNFYRISELKGRWLIQTGQVDEGLKLLKEAAARAVKDVGLHSWGGGAYVMEVWGEAALSVGRYADAEEAYSEALAHEHGSIVAALGMQVLWEKRGRPELAEHYARRAADIWKRADSGALDRQLARIRRIAGGGSQ